MRTTLDLDDALLRAARKRAAETGRSLTAVIEEALFQLLQGYPGRTRVYRIDWTPVVGEGPLVDINDRNSLYDVLDDGPVRGAGPRRSPTAGPGRKPPGRKSAGGKGR